MMKAHRLVALVGVGLFGSLALAHLWLVDRGVHFKGLAVDFGAPPSRYTMYPGNDMGGGPAWRPGTTYFEDTSADRQDSDSAKRGNLTDHAYRSAINLESRGRYRSALRIWIQSLSHCGCLQGSIRRRIELLKVLSGHPGLQGSKQLLLATRPVFAKGSLPNLDGLDPNLLPFVLYERADRIRKPKDAAHAFFALANGYPASPLAEPALIMVPRNLLGSGEEPNSADLDVAQVALDDLIRRYPNTRFRSDIVGWRGRIHYLQRDYWNALRQYRRQFDLCKSLPSIDNPIKSILLCEKELKRPAEVAAAYMLLYGMSHNMELKFVAINRLQSCFEAFSAEDGKRFWLLLRDDPRLLSFYMDFRLDGTRPVADVLALASKNDQAILNSPYKAKFLSRVTEAEYRLGRKSEAIRYGEWTLRSHPSIDEAARAEFVLGSVARRTARYQTAIRCFETIVDKYRTSYLRGGARENLALLYEHEGRYGDALDEYRTLGYPYDFAFLLDIRMSPEQIARYIDRHPHDRDRDSFVYSLGMRYLRKHSWAKAEEYLGQLSRRRRMALTKLEGDYGYDPDVQPDPLRTVHQLSRLDKGAAVAPDPSSKAKAMFAMANFYYSHRNLLLYNAHLWGGERSTAIDFSWNHRVSTKQDDKALELHFWEHECLAQAYLICRHVVNDFPSSSVKYRAAYMAACAAKRLGNFNEYWRWNGERKDLGLQAVHFMKIARRSPNRNLAAKARKYAQVFVESWYAESQAFAFEHSHHPWRDSWSGFSSWENEDN